MTVNELALLLLADFSPEERAIPDAADYPGRNAWVKSSINGAIQEYWEKTGATTREDEVGGIIYAPTTVTIAVTEGSSDATIATEYAPWMAGCSIVIVGHDIDNQIRNAETNGTGAVLKYPYGGTTGTVAALVYHDSLIIRNDVMQVLKPVRVDRQEIMPIANPGNFGTRVYGDFGRNQHTYLIPLNSRVADTVGTICGYKVETYSPTVTGEPLNRMKLAPAPAYAGIIDYMAKLKPAPIVSLASSSTLPIPNQFVESILFPMARKRLSTCPFFSNLGAVAGIESAYQTALIDAAAMIPQGDTDRRMRAVYG